MQQIKHQTKISLINYDNSTNFPSYHENQNSPLITNNIIIELNNNLNYQNGQLNLFQNPIIFNNIFYLFLTSINNFYYKVDNYNVIKTKEFLYNNLDDLPIEKVEIYNGTLDFDGYDFLPNNNTKNIMINYFSINV